METARLELFYHWAFFLGVLGITMPFFYVMVNLKTIFVWVFRWSLIVQLTAIVVCFPVVAIIAALGSVFGLDEDVTHSLMAGVFLFTCVLVAMKIYSRKRRERKIEAARTATSTE